MEPLICLVEFDAMRPTSTALKSPTPAFGGQRSDQRERPTAQGSVLRLLRRHLSSDGV